MSGHFIKVIAPEHVCEPPEIFEFDRIRPGSIWECDCGRQWELFAVPFHRSVVDMIDWVFGGAGVASVFDWRPLIPPNPEVE